MCANIPNLWTRCASGTHILAAQRALGWSQNVRHYPVQLGCHRKQPHVCCLPRNPGAGKSPWRVETAKNGEIPSAFLGPFGLAGGDSSRPIWTVEASPRQRSKSFLLGEDLEVCPPLHSCIDWGGGREYWAGSHVHLCVFSFLMSASPGKSIKTTREEQTDKERQEEARTLIHSQHCVAMFYLPPICVQLNMTSC